jgi:hypothetical protein
MKGSVMKFKIILWLLASIMLFSVPAWAYLTQTEVSQLYVSIFGRASEGEGNTYWRTQPNIATAATAMLDTDAARYYFGGSLNSNQAFIEHIYINTLSKTYEDDPAGINYWAELLESGKNTRGEVVAIMVDVIKDYAPPQYPGDPGGLYYNEDDHAAIAAYNQFTNQVEVCNYMAETVDFTPVDWETLTSFSHGGLVVTDDPATVITAKEVVDSIGMLEKPIIYLYPESIQEIYVAFEKPDSVLLTTTYPEYSIKNGWNVLAYPDGTLYDMETGLEFYALYWEGFTPKTGNYETGFVIKSEDSATFLETSLEQLGLSRREANEFIVYWLPELHKSQYNFIHFSTEDWENDVPLEIIPEPATLIRFMMYYQPLEYPIQVEPQMLESPVRKGFTVVEWGGGIIE